MRGKEFEVKKLLEGGKVEQQVGLICRLLHSSGQNVKRPSASRVCNVTTVAEAAKHGVLRAGPVQDAQAQPAGCWRVSGWLPGGA